jgi:hypothetical protein
LIELAQKLERGIAFDDVLSRLRQPLRSFSRLRARPVQQNVHNHVGQYIVCLIANVILQQWGQHKKGVLQIN